MRHQPGSLAPKKEDEREGGTKKGYPAMRSAA